MRVFLLAAISLVAAAPAAPAVTAGTVHQPAGLRPLHENPIAPRGGVMMFPLAPERPARGWPRVATLTLEDGRRVEAVLGWIHSAPRHEMHWTADPRGLGVRAIEPDDGEAVAGTPILLARLPEDGRGAIALGDFSLSPVWRDVAPLRGERLARSAAPAADRPDPESPFEYWRWVLLAERLGAAPPFVGEFTAVEGLLAQHYADLWRIGLTRLAAQSEGVAAQVRDLLTRICLDHHSSFAAWVSDPVALGDLLTTLLNYRRSGESITAEALDWADRHEGLLAWIESSNAERVRLAIVNPSFNPLVARLNWLSPHPAAAGEIPLAIELEPGRLTRVSVDRPVRRAEPQPGRDRQGASRAPGDEVGSMMLQIEWPDGALRFAPGPRTRPVVPPGLSFPEFAPPMSLAALQGAAGTPIVAERAAMVQLRRLRGRWELFFECLRPGVETRQQPEPSPPGVDEVVIYIGAEEHAGGPDVVLRVPESGWHELLRGRADGTLQVHRRAYADRWYARIVLPQSWLNTAAGEVTLFGFTRIFGTEMTHTPGPALPWRASPGRIAVDLSRWDDLPGLADEDGAGFSAP